MKANIVYGILLGVCLVFVASSPIEQLPDFYEQHHQVISGEYEPVLSRHARSPQGGSVDIGYHKDQNGREASVQYNHNLYTSSDGRGSIDAYAQANRNFDYNRNNYGGGIRGSWRF